MQQELQDAQCRLRLFSLSNLLVCSSLAGPIFSQGHVSLFWGESGVGESGVGK